MGLFDNLVSGLNNRISENHYRNHQNTSTSELKDKLYQNELWNRNQGGKCITREEANVIKQILKERGAI